MEAEPARSVARPLQRAFRGLCQAGDRHPHTIRRRALKYALPPGVSRLKHPVAQTLPRAQSSTFPPDTRLLATARPAPTPGFWGGPSVVLPWPLILLRADQFHQ